MRYAATRHNLGFRGVEQLALFLGTELKSSKFNGLYGRVWHREEEYLLLKPLTYMNRSGEAVQAFAAYFRIPLDNMLVIYDEISLDLGRVRIRPAGRGAGHRGAESVISSLGSSEFARLRLGIGPQPPGQDSASYVLESFKPTEREIVEEVIAVIPDIVMCWSHEGMTKAMSRYNPWTAP